MSKSKKPKEYNIPHSLQRYISDEELGAYEEYFNTESSKAIRKRIVELFEKKVDESIILSDQTNKYEKPAWAEYQADACGYRRAMRELIKFLK